MDEYSFSKLAGLILSYVSEYNSDKRNIIKIEEVYVGPSCIINTEPNVIYLEMFYRYDTPNMHSLQQRKQELSKIDSEVIRQIRMKITDIYPNMKTISSDSISGKTDSVSYCLKRSGTLSLNVFSEGAKEFLQCVINILNDHINDYHYSVLFGLDFGSSNNIVIYVYGELVALFEKIRRVFYDHSDKEILWTIFNTFEADITIENVISFKFIRVGNKDTFEFIANNLSVSIEEVEEFILRGGISKWHQWMI